MWFVKYKAGFIKIVFAFLLVFTILIRILPLLRYKENQNFFYFSNTIDY